MSTSVSDKHIGTVHTTDDELVVTFVDGQTLSVPLDWYPRLRSASAAQRNNWRLIGEGEGIHWSQIDEDLSAEGLLSRVTAPGARLQASSFGETHDNEQTGQALLPPQAFISPLRGANHRGANLREADLREADLREADLRGADLWGADLRGANLLRANLRGTYLRGADLRGANLQRAYLLRAHLQRANFQGANLQGAYLREAYLQNTNLQRAYLQGANLVRAYLPEADLLGADLLGADLQGAYLQGAELEAAMNLTQEQLEQAAIGDERTTIPRDLEIPAAWGGSSGDRAYSLR